MQKRNLAEYVASRVQRFREAGLCARCGKVPVGEGGYSCEACRAVSRASRRARRDARRTSGACTGCGAARDCGGVLCSGCRTAERTKRGEQTRVYFREYRRKAIAAGKCITCLTNEAAMGILQCDRCRAREKERRRRNKELGLCIVCSGPVGESEAATCLKCREKHQKRTAEIREKVFMAYGGYRCTCPGGCDVTDPEFLHIDHIEGGGQKHRKREGISSGDGFYRWLLKNGCPPGFRVLCANCNLSRGRCGYCPHERRGG